VVFAAPHVTKVTLELRLLFRKAWVGGFACFATTLRD
jgi:hypothetical protein